jgi:hypothetical protein
MLSSEKEVEEGGEEEEEEKSSVSYAHLYTAKELPSLAFPTVLDLLDIDHPVIGEILFQHLCQCEKYRDSSTPA